MPSMRQAEVRLGEMVVAAMRAVVAGEADAFELNARYFPSADDAPVRFTVTIQRDD